MLFLVSFIHSAFLFLQCGPMRVKCPVNTKIPWKAEMLYDADKQTDIKAYSFSFNFNLREHCVVSSSQTESICRIAVGNNEPTTTAGILMSANYTSRCMYICVYMTVRALTNVISETSMCVCTASAKMWWKHCRSSYS